MKKRCPIKTQLNKLYIKSTKYYDLGFHLSYERSDKTIYPHYYKSSITFALQNALKPLVIEDKLNPLINLIMDEIHKDFYSENLIQEYETILNFHPKTFKDFLVADKELYELSMSYLMSEYKNVSLKRMKDQILKTVYLCLLVHIPDYHKEYLNV